jgi:hypothetical protein
MNEQLALSKLALGVEPLEQEGRRLILILG